MHTQFRRQKSVGRPSRWENNMKCPVLLIENLTTLRQFKIRAYPIIS
jgi:hypothetical protein